jgi:hypothetical protein
MLKFELFLVLVSIWSVFYCEAQEVEDEVTIYLEFDDSDSRTQELLELHADQMKIASEDSVDYSDLTGTLSTAEGRALYYYTTNAIEGYQFEFVKHEYYNIFLKLDPCREMDDEMCCDQSAESSCGDHDVIVASTDLAIAWFTNQYIIQCQGDFLDNEECGTFIEVHRPTNPTVISQIRIEKYSEDGFSMEFISTKTLCAGRYELWFVVRSRSARILQYVKPFYCSEPSCTCEQVIEAGFECQD